MKKALALVLALVLALSLGVSAFATLSLVELEKDPVYGPSLKKVNEISFNEDDEAVLLAAAGKSYYVQLDKDTYKNIEVVGTGAVSAKVVKYDPTVYGKTESIRYYVYDSINGVEADVVALIAALGDAAKSFNKDKKLVGGYSTNSDGDLVYFTCDPSTEAITDVEVLYSYYDVLDVCELLNKENTTAKYVPKTDDNLTLIEITVEDNYSVAYKEGTVKVTAKDGRTAVSCTLTVISDVTLFRYDDVRHAAFYDGALALNSDGYSDYLTDEKGYKNPAQLDESINREDDATVVPTTAFRAIEGYDLTVENDVLAVTIYDVAAGQRGVNFEAYGLKRYNKAGYDIDLYRAVLSDTTTAAIKFGFYGDQKIDSDFEIEVNLNGMDWFDLREEFGKKLEEEDIITYYVLKDGKVYDSFTVDYMKVDPNEEVKLVIEGKAGDTLGKYEIVLEAPAAPEAPEGEENPNTGAESVIGVVAAMAVVSVAAAAAVSLKK